MTATKKICIRVIFETPFWFVMIHVMIKMEYGITPPPSGKREATLNSQIYQTTTIRFINMAGSNIWFTRRWGNILIYVFTVSFESHRIHFLNLRLIYYPLGVFLNIFVRWGKTRKLPTYHHAPKFGRWCFDSKFGHGKVNRYDGRTLS